MKSNQIKSKTGLLLVTYNRFEHSKKVIDAIKESGFDHVYVFIDGPINSYDIKQQKKISSYISSSGLSFNLIKNSSNLGLAKSIINSINYMFKIYDRLIILEDDCVPNAEFKDFFLKMLDLHENNEEVGAICGFHPLNFIDKTIIENSYFVSDRFIPWGWATWKKSWDLYEESLIRLVSTVDEILVANKLGHDISDYLNRDKFLFEKNDIWSLNWILSLFKNNLKVAYPIESLVVNIGFDGTGVHSSKTDIFDYKIDIFNSKGDNLRLLFHDEIIQFMQVYSGLAYEK